MRIGYVSDERYVAIPDVLLEFERDGESIETRSRASGSVEVDLKPGTYRVTIVKPGYGGKRITLDVQPGMPPYQFRLLSDCLLGYPWPKCVKTGEKAEFRVHSPEAYEAELWRYGYRKELVRRLGWYDEHGPRATVQITPDGDYSQTGAEWNKHGYSSPHHKQLVTAPDRTGLYYFHTKTKSGLFFSFPWVVAPQKPTCPTAVLASNITWNAYNAFGGRSNYINPDKLPPVPTVNARLELGRYTDPEHVNYGVDDYAPLSFERPEMVNFVPENEVVTNPIEGRTACHLAPAEWRLLGWFEREDLPYDYYSETQFQDGTFKLDDYKVLVISTHPEYWSKKMYFELKDWIQNRGGKLMYLGGNGLNSEVEFVGESAMIVRNADERQRISKGLESRMHHRIESEASVLGVVFTDTGIMTGAPFRVVDADHWAFAGTGLKNGDIFGQESLHRRCPGGASGHETDKISPFSPPGTHLLAKGLNPDDGGAHLSIYHTASKGAAFAAGSISWPASILVDDAVSKITTNVLRKFLE